MLKIYTGYAWREMKPEEEAADLRCGLDSRTDENRIYVGEWVFDGKAVDAVRIIEEVEG